MQKLSLQEASNVLTAWSIIEILSPQSFNKRTDLVGGDESRVMLFTNNIAPWEKGIKSSPNKKLFYQVVIGTIDLGEATKLLLEKYKIPDINGEKEYTEVPTVKGETIIGTILVDENGYLIKDKDQAIKFCLGSSKSFGKKIKRIERLA